MPQLPWRPCPLPPWCRTLCILVTTGAALASPPATKPARAEGRRAEASPATSPAATTPAAFPHTEARTAHYSIYAEGWDAAEVGRLLEAYYPLMAQAMGAAPPADRLPLRVELYHNGTRFKAALAADGEHGVDAGGYYWPENAKAYLALQPSPYYTRQLLLHECTHQFHFLARTANRAPKAEWYNEGLAEYFGMHAWDGTTLRLGVAPLVTLEDYPARAARHFAGDLHENLEGIIAGRRPCERPEAWALIHFLAHTRPAAFERLRAALDGGADPAEAWKQSLGPVTGDTVRQFKAHLRGLRQPWQIMTVQWQQWGQAVEGETDTTAIVLLKETPAALSAALEPLDAQVQPGLVFGYRSLEDYWEAQRMPGRAVRFCHRDHGHWKEVKTLKPSGPAPADGRDVLTAVLVGDQVTVLLNGEVLRKVPAKGRVGLFVQEGRARFHVLGPAGGEAEAREKGED